MIVNQIVQGGGGGADLSWLAASTPTPSVRNFFYALANGATEHGEFLVASTPSDMFIDMFEMTNFSEINKPQGMLIIDKDFYQGVSGLPNNSTTANVFCWLDKAFINPASDSNVYMGVFAHANQTATGGGSQLNTQYLKFDETVMVEQAYFKMSGRKVQIKHRYNNNHQYTFLLPNRTYIWIAY